MSECFEIQQLVLIDPEASDVGTPVSKEKEVGYFRRVIPAGIAVLGCTLLAFCIATRQPAAGSARSTFDRVVELLEENRGDACAALPYVRLEKVLHTNLGGKGPDEGKEGVVFQASAYHSGLQTKAAEVHLHAITDYHPTWPKANGIQGHFGELNLAPGTNTTFQVYAVDPETKKNLTLSHGSFTFFDLDHGKNERSAEYIQIGNFAHYYIANNTELHVVEHEDQTVTFQAGNEGNGGDNPTDALALSPLQKRRAVTLNFQNLTSLTFVLGSTEGNTTRVFHFVLRPSLLCADTVFEDGTIVKALEQAAGNVAPMQDGKVPVSLSHLKRLVDDYDCTNAEAAGDWPEAKKAWCCDRRDVGCEVLGIGGDDEILEDGNETGEENSTADSATTPGPSHSGAITAVVRNANALPAVLAAALAWRSATARISA